MTARSYGRLPPHQKHATLSDVVAHWKLNEANASDDALDYGASGLDLSENSTPSPEAGPHKDSDSAASLGARNTDGNSWFEEPAGNEGASSATLQAAYGYTVAAWVKPNSGYASNGAIVCYDAFGTAEDDNIQFRLSILSDLEIATRWEYDAGSNETVASGQYVTEDEWTHVAIVVVDDDENHNKRQVHVYVNGEVVHVRKNLEPATGGADAFWQIGASYDASGDSGVTPGQIFDGAISDVAVYPFAGSPEFCRDCYARAVKDFQITATVKKDGTTLSGPDRYNETLESVSVFTRVKVRARDNDLASDGFQDALGWVDLSSLFDVDIVLDTRISDEQDAQASSATVTLSTRLFGEIGIGALLTSPSVLIKAEYDNPLDGDVAREGLEIKIEHAWMPHGSNPESARPHFMCMFHGVVVTASHGIDTVKLDCIDLTQSLQDQWVEPHPQALSDGQGSDITLGSGGGTDLEDNLQALIDRCNPARFQLAYVDDTGGGGTAEFELFLSTQSSTHLYGRPHLFVAGDKVLVQGTTNFNGVFTVASVTDEQITSTEVPGAAAGESPSSAALYGLPSKHGMIGCTPGFSGGFELYVPTSPGWAQREYNVPSTMNLATAIEEQASQIGWLCRFKWDDDRKQYRLTLYDPAASGSTRYAAPNIITDTSEFKFSGDNKRNVVVVEYRNASAALPDGGHQRSAVVAKDATTVQRYRRRYARMGLFNATNIDSATEAQALANIAIASMGGEDADTFSVEMPWTPDIGIGDTLVIIAEAANTATGHTTGTAAVFPKGGTRFLAQTDSYRVSGVEHSGGQRGVFTSLQLRPSGGGGQSRKFRDLMTEKGRTGGDGTRGVNSSTAPTLTEVGGPAILVQWPSAARANVLSRMYSHTEVHCSTSNGFTPSSTTLVDSVSSLQSTIRRTISGGLVIASNTDYYVKLIHIDQAGNRVTSSQATITTAP